MSDLVLIPTHIKFNPEPTTKSFLVPVSIKSHKLAGDEAELNVEATTLQHLIDQLLLQVEWFRTRLLDESGQLRRFINVYVNEEDVRFLKNLDTPIKEGDEVFIIPAISGG